MVNLLGLYRGAILRRRGLPRKGQMRRGGGIEGGIEVAVGVEIAVEVEVEVEIEVAVGVGVGVGLGLGRLHFLLSPRVAGGEAPGRGGRRLEARRRPTVAVPTA